MKTKTGKTSGTKTLAQFQTIIRQREGTLGRLVGLSSIGDHNIMTFLVEPPPAAEKRVELELVTGSEPTEFDGWDLVTYGTCLIEGASKGVAAYRKR